MTWFEFIVAYDQIVGTLVAVIVGAGTALVAVLTRIRRTGRTTIDAGRAGDPAPPVPHP